MNRNFDEIIDRKNTNSIKYDFAKERGKPEGILPLWVADMDFKAPDPVLDDLLKAVSHGIFGYTEVKRDYFDAVYQWFLKHFEWETKKEWLVKAPGVVYALACAVRAFTKEGDAVLIQQPVYYPFTSVIEDNNRRLIINPLVYQDYNYRIDFEDMERKIIEEQVKLFILCSPHNPVGRVWTKEELVRLGNLCLKHQVLILSDEIHCDFTYPGHPHTVFSSINEDFADYSIICTAPSKTFNLAGLQVSNIFIKNPVLRRKFIDEIRKTGYSQLNTLGLIACQSAYANGEPWLNELKLYLQDNLSYVRQFLKDNLPQIRLVEPQGTYLIWLDFSALSFTEEKMEHMIVHKAGLWLDGGTMFGASGLGFQRINIACPRDILKDAMQKLLKAMKELEE
ncbi:MAG: aminotransferase [Herbinix sp.]|jgi:cystathionine beta-lyase|nr:aminotransferase [Herbinix sp.]